MALSAAEAERAEFSGRRGDDIERTWTRASGGAVYTAGSLLVQIRAGGASSSRLVATSDWADETAAEFVRRTGADPGGSTFAADLAAWLDAAPVAEITTTGTALDADPPVIAWQCAATEYELLRAGSFYWLGIDVVTGGLRREVQRHAWSVLEQTAVRGA